MRDLDRTAGQMKTRQIGFAPPLELCEIPALLTATAVLAPFPGVPITRPSPRRGARHL